MGSADSLRANGKNRRETMGQSINVLLYGCRVPGGVDLEPLLEDWEEHVAARVEAFGAKLRAKKVASSDGLARDAFVPCEPFPDDADPDGLIGFYVCCGYHDHAESHRFRAMTPAEARRDERAGDVIRRCRRRWSRFARWARAHGVEFGKPRIWRTRAEVA